MTIMSQLKTDFSNINDPPYQVCLHFCVEQLRLLKHYYLNFRIISHGLGRAQTLIFVLMKMKSAMETSREQASRG
jgi:hypothetical protein